MPKIIDHDVQRGEIADAFLRVIADKGPSATTMRNVAREAGCSPSLPMHYFDSRPALIEFAFARQANDLVTELRAITSARSSARDRLRHVIAHLVNRSCANGAAWRSAIAMIVKAEQNSVIEGIDRQCFLDHLAILTDLLSEYAAETGMDMNADAEAAMLLTAVDGLALATVTLGEAAPSLSTALMNFLAHHYAIVLL